MLLGEDVGMGVGFRRFAATLAAFNRRRLLWVTAVQLAAAASQVLGLFLLIPLLVAAGVAPGSSTTGVTRFFRSALGAIGVTLTLRSMLVVYVITIALAAALNAYATVMLTRYRAEFVDGLRSRLYAAIGRAEWRHLLGLRQSELLTTLTANVLWVSSGTTALLSLAVALLLVVAQLTVAARISPAFTLIAVASGAVLIAVVWPLIGRSRRLGRDLVDNTQALYGSVTGFLDGLKLAKAHALEAPHVDAFAEAVGRSRDSEIALAKASALATAIQLVATAAVLGVIVDIAIEHLHVDLAALLVLAFIFTRLVPQIAGAQRNLQQVAQALPPFNDLMTVIAGCEEEAEPLPPTVTASRPIGEGVEVTGVSFAYVTGRRVLHDVSIEIPGGSTVALVGPSGAGKTTLADITIGLLAPDEGDVRVDGRPLGDDHRSWRAAVALVPQEPFLFHDTVSANLRWAAPSATDDQLRDALATAAAAEFVDALPSGIDTVVGDRGVRLSGGERQRIALARALLRRPQLLVLDEATSSLDTENERAIREALMSLHGQLTMLVIAHRLSTVRHADTVIVLDEGRVVERGAWEELAQRAGGRLRSLLDAGAVE